VRILAGLILLALLAGAQDDDYDEFGFPITFDADIITLNDVVRSAGVDSAEAIGSMRNERDKFLMERLLDKVADLFGIEITVRQIDDWMAQEIARFDSEAEFYDSLLQEGLTLELKKDEIRRRLLDYYMQQLFRFGFIDRGQKLLPWDPQATPEEIRIAFQSDPARKNQGIAVRWQELVIDISKQERARINLKRAMDPDITQEAVEKEIREKVEPLTIQVRELLNEGKSLELIAAELKLEFATREDRLPQEPSKLEATRFLQTAEAGATSEALGLPRSRWVVLHVLEIVRPGDQNLSDPNVVNAYRQRIGVLKQRWAEYTLRLRALDESDLRPERVRTELRELILTTLKQVRRELRTLGLH
jgi:hypothetical protein